ncbi:uncharacterized protein H6S33_003228 [Morchella sextelata]|uniref:uncharacterized protein n=1 Tax=Morchella sextelata TaxID=1174677 RepID=UPI001D03BF71|nr:uncharacterized protein H6S33_003228 [Morchella sextelata]KAH0607240.1 hypothetical protein H6S33_003228 [Morchella sextelata]
MSSTSAQDPSPSSSKRTRTRRAQAQNRYDKPIRPLREIAPKSSTLVDGKDPREGALAEEIRMIKAAALAEEILKLNSATGSKLELNGTVTDPDLDGEYSTDEEYILQIQAGHNLSSTQAFDEQSAEDLRTGTYMYQNRVMRLRAPFVPDIMVTNPAEHLLVPVPYWADIHDDRETPENSLRPSLPVPGPTASPSQGVGELRRSPRRHVRRGATEVLKRRKPALQVAACSSKASSHIIGKEKVPEAVYNIDDEKTPEVLPGVGKGKASEAPEVIPIIDKGKAPEVVHRVEKRKAPSVVRRAVKRKTEGTIRKIDNVKAPEAIGEFNERTGTHPVRMLDKGKAPEVVPHFKDGAIDPILLSKNPNFDNEYLSRAREADSWPSERVGNMRTDEMKLHSNFELPPGTNWETPTFNSEQLLPQSENDIIEAQIRADEGIDWAYDPQEYSYFDLAFFPEHASDKVETESEMSQFFKSSMNINEPVAGSSDQDATNRLLYPPPNDGLTLSSLTGLPLYDWGFQEQNAEETKLPDANDFGYFLEETNHVGVIVRTFYPYTEEDDLLFR